MNSIHPRFRFVGSISWLLMLPFLAGADGKGCAEGTTPVAPGASSDAGVSCAPADCAGLAATQDAKTCPGGASVARTVCRGSAAGKCGWEFPPCPSFGDAGDACECAGPSPSAPNVICSDGSTGGPVCSRDSAGSCGWQIRSCPVQACPALGCFPNCPNGILKDSRGCETCQCVPAADGGDAGTTCKSDRDCMSGRICGFPKVDACAATGTCFAASPLGCNAYSAGCACDGSEVNITCTGLPSGYVPAPLLHTGACADSGPYDDGGDGGACCPVGWGLYSCTYPDGGVGAACHNPQLGCASSSTCGQGCDGVVTGRCAH